LVPPAGLVMILDSLSRDISYAFRSLHKSAGFSLTAIVTLGLGIGATTAMFSVLNGVLLRPLPFRDPDRLVLIRERLPKLLPKPISIQAADVVSFEREAASFDGIAGFITRQFDLTGEGVPQRITAARVEWNLFSVLGAAPMLGRGFVAHEDHPESYVAVVSYRFWKQQLGGTPSVLGKTIALDRKPYEIIGVMPQDFTFPLHVDELAEIWVPMGYTPDELKVGGTSFAYGALARLKPGVSMVQAQTDVDRVTTHIAQAFPAVQRGDLQIFGVVVPFLEEAIGDYRKPLLVLFLAVLFVLLIAVVNVANLLLARGTARQRELAIRIALGAGARQIVAQLLVESAVLGIVGGAFGIVLAVAATRTVVAMVPAHIPRLQAATVDPRVLGFALALSLVAGITFGAIPALFAMRTNVNENLKEGGRGASVGRHHQRVRSGFVVAQVALALILLAGAGLLLRSFRRVLEVDPGFRPEDVITASVSLSPTQYAQPVQVNSFFKELNGRLQQIPGAKAAGLATDLPLETKMESALTVDGYTPPPGGSGLNAFSFVMGDYFQAMGIPLIRGRLFTPADDENAEKVVLINQSLARRFFGGREAIGGRLKLGTAGGTAAWSTVVGIVGDVKPFGLDQDSLPHTYMPYVQHTPVQLKGGTALTLVLAVRTAGNPVAAASSIRTAVWSLDRQVPVTSVRTMEQVVSESNAPRRFTMVLVGLFAAAALLLAAVGLYGLMSYSVSHRTHEIGVRMTLGAARSDVLRMVLGSGFKLVLVGVAAGIVGALATSRLLASFLFDVRPSDPLTFAAVALLLAAIAMLASLVPALRATRVDPMIALRNE
jgi:putative ABC transport system permease protein